MYHLPRICRTLVPEICVHPEMLRILKCSRAWFTTICTRMNCKDNWSYSCLPWRLSTGGQVGEFADTWYKQIQSPETVELLAVAARQFANTPVWIRNDRWLTVLLFCDVHIGIGTTLSLLQCLRVICGCRPVQTNSAETSLALLHM